MMAVHAEREGVKRRFMPRFQTHRILGGLLTVGIPVGFMVGMHLTWMPDFNSRMRMASQHAGFWGGMAAALVIHHRKWYASLKQGLLMCVGLSLLPILGFWGGKAFGRTFFPKTNQLHGPTPMAYMPPAVNLAPGFPPTTAWMSSYYRQPGMKV